MSFPAVRPIVCLITSGECTHENFSSASTKVLDIVSAAVLSQVSIVQIREKSLDGKQLFELVSKAVSLTTGSMTKLLVNGRSDVAVAAGADGVHLPSDAYPAEVARRLGGREFLVGVSVHKMDEIAEAQKEGADYVVLGPIFDTSGKSGKGVEFLARAVRKFPDFPILALGGIDENNLSDVMASGAAGFAAIRYLNDRRNLNGLSEVLRKLTIK